MKITHCRVLSCMAATLFLCLSLLLPVGAHALITSEQQMRTVYNADNGFPSDTVQDIAMTSDGLLWFATADGLIRYNGYDFACINKLTEPTFPAMRVAVLCPAAAGELWVGTNDSGLLHYANGTWSAITTAQGALPDSVCDINLLEDGSVAVAVPTGVYFVNADGTLGETYPLENRALVVQDIAVGKAGNVFGVTGDGALFSILDGGFTFSSLTREGNYTYTAVDSADGRFLLGTSGGEIIVMSRKQTAITAQNAWIQGSMSFSASATMRRTTSTSFHRTDGAFCLPTAILCVCKRAVLKAFQHFAVIFRAIIG